MFVVDVEAFQARIWNSKEFRQERVFGDSVQLLHIQHYPEYIFKIGIFLQHEIPEQLDISACGNELCYEA